MTTNIYKKRLDGIRRQLLRTIALGEVIGRLRLILLLIDARFKAPLD
ncbi:TPA: hypothetical protein VDB83_002907 [Burkholderia cenocepacia]|nr:hypothetical protein [Burkholderia cenocepacia]MBR8099513.1 hypothetical protein [Burkholderia cenocepacia]HEP6428608.1 hypothetical protein [Burkholderia cenocepacia]